MASFTDSIDGFHLANMTTPVGRSYAAVAAILKSSETYNDVTVTTENGALAHATTMSPLLDAFGALTRDLTPLTLVDHLNKAWAVSPLRTLQLIAYLRDARNGLGERRLYYYAAVWLAGLHPEAYKANLALYLDVGCYRDLLALLEATAVLTGTRAREATQLDPAYQLFISRLRETKPDLAAKWAPSEGCHHDWLARAFAKSLGLTNKQYRQMLVTKRAELKLVESALCQKRDADITFSRVPSRAMLKYAKTFSSVANHPELATRYAEYLDAVKAGTAKINSGTLMAYEIAKRAREPTAEALWADTVTRLKTAGTMADMVAVVDVSGSMSGHQPIPGVSAMDIAISLGLLVASVSQAAAGRIITFSQRPVFVDVKLDQPLVTQLGLVKNSQWDMSTNFTAVFKLLLSQPADTAPKRLVVFTDMQFDAAGGKTTPFEQIKADYTAAGRVMPQILFWNLAAARGTTQALPITVDDHGTALISGFSQNLFTLFTETTELNPLTLLNDALDRYPVVVPAVGEEPPGTATPTADQWAALTKLFTPTTKKSRAAAKAAGDAAAGDAAAGDSADTDSD